MSNNINNAKHTVHIVVKSPYTVQILKNTNPIEFTVHHYVKSDSVTVYDMRPDTYDNRHVISAVLSSKNVHHDKGDQMMYTNERVNLIVEYQLIGGV
ncbi:MAG: hypothetical protein R2685_07930 [Candidatus Nitrosocosmicus sp.]|jgi:glutamate formiminotransferase|nr:hypothetical protein [Candidatus Nitrosocosmicus sp.]